MQKRAAHLMIALAPVRESGCSCDIVVRLLVLSHLSFFMKEKGTSSAWPLLVRHLTATARVNVEKLFASLMPDILKELLQERYSFTVCNDFTTKTWKLIICIYQRTNHSWKIPFSLLQTYLCCAI